MAGGVAATPEEYRKSQNQFLNHKLRKAVDDMDIQPGPIYEINTNIEADMEPWPWKVWKIERPKTLDVRAYVEANTVYDSNDLDVSEILKGAEWPDNRKGIGWPERIIFYGGSALLIYLVSLL